MVKNKMVKDQQQICRLPVQGHSERNVKSPDVEVLTLTAALLPKGMPICTERQSWPATPPMGHDLR